VFGWLFYFYILKKLYKITFLASLSANALMGGAFLHLLLEAAQEIETSKLYLIVLAAFIFFFFMEKLLFWRHCHKENCPILTFRYM